MMDISGERYGMLTAVKQLENGRYPNGQLYYVWECVCDCGKTVSVRLGNLRSGHTTSCGCWKQNRKYTHKLSKTRLYKVWLGMKNRCYAKSSEHYKTYGGKGVTVCDEWRNNYLAFHKWAIENGYCKLAERGICTIDRINTNGNYEPENCRIVDMQIQSNNRINCRYITAFGETDTVSNMARKYGINNKTLTKRLNSGWDYERAVSSAVRTN